MSQASGISSRRIPTARTQLSTFRAERNKLNSRILSTTLCGFSQSRSLRLTRIVRGVVAFKRVLCAERGDRGDIASAENRLAPCIAWSASTLRHGAVRVGS